MKKMFVITAFAIFTGGLNASVAQETTTEKAKKEVKQEVNENKKFFKDAGKTVKKGASKAGSAVNEEVNENKKFFKQTGKSLKKGSRKAGAKSSELAAKGQSEIVDKVYEGKIGPNGERIYITNESKYYWVDKKGKRHYINEAALKDKEA